MKKKKVKWYDGYIRWFDNLSGEGIVNIPELNRSFYVHWSADQSLDKLENKSLSVRPKNLFIEYHYMDQVSCTIFEDSHYSQVDRIFLCSWIKYEDLVSDILLKYLESADRPTPGYFEDHVLNNIIQLTERQ